MWPPRRYTANIASVNRMRLRRSGIRKMLASLSNINYRTSTLPPALVIFSWADLENLWAWTVSGALNSPSPRILIGDLPFTTPALRRTSGVIVVSPKPASFSRLTIVYSVRKMLAKPRFGRRRCNGIWPPSNPRIMREPLRERCPLCPRAEVLPMPDPMPRPTRFLFDDAFFGARMFERFMSSCLSFAPSRRLLLHDLHQVRNLCH